jgi:hypothetical protein
MVEKPENQKKNQKTRKKPKARRDDGLLRAWRMLG